MLHFNQEQTLKYSAHVGSPREYCCVQGVQHRDFPTTNDNYATTLSSQKREEKAMKLCSNWTSRQNIFTQLSAENQETATKISNLLTYKTEQSESFSDGQYLKDCIIANCAEATKASSSSKQPTTWLFSYFIKSPVESAA